MYYFGLDQSWISNISKHYDITTNVLYSVLFTTKVTNHLHYQVHLSSRLRKAPYCKVHLLRKSPIPIFLKMNLQSTLPTAILVSSFNNNGSDRIIFFKVHLPPKRPIAMLVKFIYRQDFQSP